MTVQLGVFLDARNPSEWRRPWSEHYGRLLDLVVHAEALGADAVWLSEHHFFDDGYLPQPFVLAGAIAARTHRIRIGTAVVVTPLRHPLHIAEEAAVVDQLSGGRFELGLGAGWSPEEFDAFGVDITARFELTEAAVVAVREALQHRVTPPPAQQPLPLWIGYQRPAGARRAGRLGVGLLSLDRASLDPYRAGLREAGHDPRLARMGGLVEIIVADDPKEALDRIIPHYAHQLNSYSAAYAWGSGGAAPLVTSQMLSEGTRPAGAVGLNVCTSDQAIEAITSATAGLPVHHVYAWASVAGMPDDLVERHLELLFTKVRPALQERDRLDATGDTSDPDPTET